MIARCKNSVIPTDDNVTSIGDRAFYQCPNLESVTIGNGVTNIRESVFSGCSGLTSITIPESVTKIGESVFCACEALTEIIFKDPEGWYTKGAEGYEESVDVSDSKKTAEFMKTLWSANNYNIPHKFNCPTPNGVGQLCFNSII